MGIGLRKGFRRIFIHGAFACKTEPRVLHGPASPIAGTRLSRIISTQKMPELGERSSPAKGGGRQKTSEFHLLFLIMLNTIDTLLYILHTYELNVN